MLKAVVLILAVCGALSALSLNKETGESKPAASVGPAELFSSPPENQTTTSTPTNKTTVATTSTPTNKTTVATTPPPTTKPTKKTTIAPTTKPTNKTTIAPTTTPTNKTTIAPTTKPTNKTTIAPTTKPTNKTTIAPTTKPTNKTTIAPTTTPTNKTTIAPTTKPTNKTTIAPTTKPTNKTTIAPTTKPTTKPTTTTIPATTPSTTVTVGNYSLKTDKGTCLKADMGLKIRLESKEANGTFIVQPEKTSVQGGCKETTANLTLVFSEGFITFLFNKTAPEKTVYVDALSFKLTYPLINAVRQSYNPSNTTLHLFSARVGHAYSCKEESVYMGNGLYLDVTQDRMQAFNLTANDFGTSDPCPADKPDYRVAIAVGVTLLVLIVVVVVVYLLGRRKRTDGYQSL